MISNQEFENTGNTNDLISLQVDQKKEIENINIDNNCIITSENIVEVDGSILEGGGQILRISLSLAVLFNKQIRINNIRGKRPKPGLQRQHLAACLYLAELTDSKLEGAKLSSKELHLIPGDFFGKKEFTTKCDCNGAGSIGLVIQQILPCLIYIQNKPVIELIGGTIVSHAPPTFYLDEVLKIILKKLGIEFEIVTKKHGLFPIGNGVVNFSVNPVSCINPITVIERGKLLQVKIRFASTNNFSINSDDLCQNIHKEVKKSLKLYLQFVEKSHLDMTEDFNIEDIINIQVDMQQLHRSKNTFTQFCQVVMIFENTVISVEQLFSEKKETTEIKDFKKNILSKFDELLNNDKVCFDEFTVDHLIIFMALAKGRSRINIGNISMHTLTAFEIIKKFVPGLEIEVCKKEDYNILEIEGINWVKIE